MLGKGSDSGSGCARMSGWQAVPTMRMSRSFSKTQPVALGEHGFSLTSSRCDQACQGGDPLDDPILEKGHAIWPGLRLESFLIG